MAIQKYTSASFPKPFTGFYKIHAHSVLTVWRSSPMNTYVCFDDQRGFAFVDSERITVQIPVTWLDSKLIGTPQ